MTDMTVLGLDVETTFQIDDKGKKDPSPYNPENYLVSVGVHSVALRDSDGGYVAAKTSRKQYFCIEHNTEDVTPNFFKSIQEYLDRTNMVVGHNLKFDREWLVECGWKVPDNQWDTMLAAYVEHKGMKKPLSLEECCKEYEVREQKASSFIQDYLREGIGFEAIPWDTVKAYGTRDVLATLQVFLNQIRKIGVTVDDLLSSSYPDD